MTLNVYQVDRCEFEVKEDTLKYVVDLEKKHCICNVFDIDKIPCIHAIAAAKFSKRDENNYRVINVYLPGNIDDLSCPPPTTKKRNGRSSTKRIRSVGEFGVPESKFQSYKCSIFSIGGYNKSTCKTAI
ncbi:hypothetical protein N665_0174s0024 [Sinapis alba]|nr:hypothetical protein N665_0174s0024 [Sinapis alba]